ncbi:MAG: hypothetical protein LBV18_02125 [Alistipes sp.]|jgi:hypothetical protein|nr:hypothetical protein [Alistipes sp.]
MKRFDRSLRTAVLAMVFAAVSALTACVTDDGVMPRGQTDDRVKMRFRVEIPAMGLSATRNGTGAWSDATRNETRGTTYTLRNDETIGSACLLILRENAASDGYEFWYSVVADGVEAAGSGASFEAELLPSDHPVKVIAMLNCPATTLGTLTGMAEETPEEDVREAFLVESTDLTALLVGTGGIPMSGEVTLPSVRQLSSVVVTIPAIRSMAAVEVAKDLTYGSKQFRVTGAHVYHIDGSLRVVPDLSALDPMDPTRVTAPSMSVAAGGGRSPIDAVITDDGTDLTYPKMIVVPESTAVTDPAEKISDAACVVVEGVFEDDANPTFFRLDFDPGGDGSRFGEVLRNNKYLFTIKNVGDRGAATEEAALQNLSPAIEYDVATEEPFELLYFPDTGDFIQIGQTNLTMGGQAGGNVGTSITSTLPLEFRVENQPTDRGWITATEMAAGAGATATGMMIVSTFTADTTDPEYSMNMSFMSIMANNTGQEKTQRVFIRYRGHMTTITVTQASL